MIVKAITYSDCKRFCKDWHYSRTCPPGKEYFGLFLIDGVLAGIACYGPPAMRNQAKCYGADLELRRFCCSNDTPPESWFLGKTLKLLKMKGYKKILSLADPNYGHTGVIYKAANFEYLGLEQGGGSRDIYIDGKKVHSRTAFALYGSSGLRGLQERLPESKIEVKNKLRKHVYVYNLKGRRKNGSNNL